MRSRTLQKSILFLFTVSALLLLAACGPSTGGTTPSLESAPAVVATTDTAAVPTAPPASVGEAYPPPAAVVEGVEPYPGAGEAAPPPANPPGDYPPAAETFQEPRFRFDTPITAATAIITGQAPPDTSLAIMDVTYNGSLLGAGRSDSSGRFSIPVSGLVAGNRIGIGIGEIPSGQSLNDLAEHYFPYRGEGFMNLPNVGIFYDTVLIEP
ncbi:MAG: hypothetical protein KBF17_02400 [Candidatus Promineofilum sp.]|nr:hypothetical protein [Promineifilum sp.]MBP9657414.1 hypothetical protein [Promineifilum sp.]